MPSGSSTRRRPQEPPSKAIEPGATLLTRMPSPIHSRASALDIAICAALEALYSTPPPLSRPKIEEMLTIAPPPAAARWGRARSDISRAESRFASSEARIRPSTSPSRIEPPALLTSASTPP